MEKKFKALRAIGTLWKVLAWVELILGILAAIGLLLMGIMGVDLFGALGSQAGVDLRNLPSAAGIMGGIAGFIVVVIASLVYFLLLYAAGELVYLGLAVEENTRGTAYNLAAWIQQQSQVYAAPAPQAYPAVPAYPVQQPFTPPPAEYPPSESSTAPIEG